jgi:hypothetical protein
MTDQMQMDLICEVCGINTRIPGYGEQFGKLHAHWGYGAKHDGEHYRVHLCESCFFGALAYLREQRRIHTLFDDDQPEDDQVFGRVARDDYFGES